METESSEYVAFDFTLLKIYPDRRDFVFALVLEYLLFGINKSLKIKQKIKH